MKRLLFTGTSAKNFKHLGQLIVQPMIKITPIAANKNILEQFKNIATYDWLIFTSKHAVNYFFKLLQQAKKTPADFSRLKIMSIGKATATQLKNYTKENIFIAKEETSEGIINFFQNLDINQIKNKKIFIPNSSLSRNYLKIELEKMGASVIAMPIYQNTKTIIKDKINLNTIDQIIFTSPSTFHNFMLEYKLIPAHITLYCLSNVTKTAIKKYGLKGELLNNELSTN